jgi:hypothetical protein
VVRESGHSANFLELTCVEGLATKIVAVECLLVDWSRSAKRHQAEHAVCYDQSAGAAELPDAPSHAPSVHPLADRGDQRYPNASCRVWDRCAGREQQCVDLRREIVRLKLWVKRIRLGHRQTIDNDPMHQYLTSFYREMAHSLVNIALNQHITFKKEPLSKGLRTGTVEVASSLVACSAVPNRKAPALVQSPVPVPVPGLGLGLFISADGASQMVWVHFQNWIPWFPILAIALTTAIYIGMTWNTKPST